MVIIKTKAEEVSIHAVSPLSIFAGAPGAGAALDPGAGVGAATDGAAGPGCAVSCARVKNGIDNQTRKIANEMGHRRL